ncbi:DUF4292 domain-containing protein [Segatella maculosa]|uniref:DUF4292 domain-containing protein n=1 Tax=Segatella maculosa TaxID=439703 RepID=UPI0023F3B533|nr:DUF4292 domain-containing protein [Segatella maculosa]
MKTKLLYSRLILPALLVLFAACGAKKNLVKTTTSTTVATKTTTGNAPNPELQKLGFLQKVADNAVYANNIVGDMKFNLKVDGRDITAPGSLHMRKNQVIRIQLFIPLLGSEVGRLEFTPDYVLVIDRFHKEYIKADYNQLDFLKDNGLTFYSLQSLFWNQLFLPGIDRLNQTSLRKFEANLQPTTATTPISLKQGNLNFVWNADTKSGLIGQTTVGYHSAQHGNSTLTWLYENFMNVGVKRFPAKQTFTFSTTATRQKRTVQVTIDMDEVTTKDGWETNSTVSSKYKKIETKDILAKIMSF